MQPIMERETNKRPLSPEWDPWDPWNTRSVKGHYELTSVEFTVTHLCNLRCKHCAVGDTLSETEGESIPVEQLIRRLEEVETLQTISITGGEPVFNPKTVKEIIRPLLRYAQERGLYTQINTNLTLPLSRYEEWVEDVDVVHISYNYRDASEFHRVVYANYKRDVSPDAAEKLFNRLVDNAKSLSKAGVFVSAETYLSPYTILQIEEIHRDVASMGCLRHEIHPLYPSDFARDLELITLDQYREAVRRLIKTRVPNLWILFGTFPFYPCSERREDLDLLREIHREEGVTIRQDPDGRNRLNVNIFTGDIIVTDFGDIPPLGNIHTDRISDAFDRWLQTPLARQLHCYCPEARCTGPNPLVANTYYSGTDFRKKTARMAL